MAFSCCADYELHNEESRRALHDHEKPWCGKCSEVRAGERVAPAEMQAPARPDEPSGPSPQAEVEK